MSDDRPQVFERTLIDPDGVEVKVGGATQAALNATVADIQAGWSRRAALVQFGNAIDSRADVAVDINWDLIDQYCHPDVAQGPFVRGQSPNAGVGWGAPTAAQAADRLRLMASWLLVENIQLARAVSMIGSVVRQLIANADIDPPSDR